MSRAAYAISEDGKTALMFKSRALRDWFIAELPPKRENSFGKDFMVGTCDQYRKVLRAEARCMNDRGTRADREYLAFDMSVGEYWDCELDEMWTRAIEMGLM